ncbi:MAG: 4Fe-4S binding protein [Clostridiales bacterium]|nr:4Fe-4S binding protein [Clostridiales bacterium]
MTMLFKERNYCHRVCPIAFIQDATIGKKDKSAVNKKGNILKYSKSVAIGFWIILFAITVYYSYIGNEYLLWHRLLLVMWSTLASAIILQEIYGKRTWCQYFCPLRHVLNYVLKKSRRIVR